jgi:transcriptional regulator with XRE-family HTH domain
MADIAREQANLAALGQAIERRRGHVEMSRDSLAARTGATLETVEELEAGSLDADYDLLLDVAEELGTDLSSLISSAEALSGRSG